VSIPQFWQTKAVFFTGGGESLARGKGKVEMAKSRLWTFHFPL
jgi:hypothetical protein